MVNLQTEQPLFYSYRFRKTTNFANVPLGRTKRLILFSRKPKHFSAAIGRPLGFVSFVIPPTIRTSFVAIACLPRLLINTIRFGAFPHFSLDLDMYWPQPTPSSGCGGGAYEARGGTDAKGFVCSRRVHSHETAKTASPFPLSPWAGCRHVVQRMFQSSSKRSFPRSGERP